MYDAFRYFTFEQNNFYSLLFSSSVLCTKHHPTMESASLQAEEKSRRSMKRQNISTSAGSSTVTHTSPHLFDSRKLPEKSVPYLKMRMLLHFNRKGPPGATGVVGKIAQKRWFSNDMVLPKNHGFSMVFLPKMIMLGCFLGIPPFKETPISSSSSQRIM